MRSNITQKQPPFPAARVIHTALASTSAASAAHSTPRVPNPWNQNMIMMMMMMLMVISMMILILFNSSAPRGLRSLLARAQVVIGRAALLAGLLVDLLLVQLLLLFLLL